MKIFVCGGTGVLGRSVLGVLRTGGHHVRATARGPAKADLVRSLGAEPVDVDLYNVAALRRSIAGCDAVLRLATKIPPVGRMRLRGAWTETNHLRTEGARLLVDAAIAERLPLYVHESVTFVYADGGPGWLDEAANVDDGGTAILRAALEGERETARFSQSGGRGVVLRFAGFYGPDAPSAATTARMARRRMLPQLGDGTNYFSSIYVSDAARAVVASLDVAAGVYNVCDDSPVPLAEYLAVLAAAVGAPSPLRLPAWLGPWIFGDVWTFLSRSQRVSNGRFTKASTWTPEVKDVSQGWPLTAAAWGTD